MAHITTQEQLIALKGKLSTVAYNELAFLLFAINNLKGGN